MDIFSLSTNSLFSNLRDCELEMALKIKKRVSYTVDFSKVDKQVANVQGFKDYILRHFKAEKRGLKGQTSSLNIDIDQDTIRLSSRNIFAKRYVKCLVQQYLFKKQARDLYKVNKTSVVGYQIRPYASE
ncbi:Ribosomal protein L22e like protein [Aduncisulcus paluster]|uniref:Ribosomal protein L22e like protein n=1 Tax=Aduncisulcus paluster TaxID=2918883 RepID=A0ABQ5KX39_9EUKA|nr:Ribosomal protein L22e like protein [Aduncisulcus paluster]